jgi:hypothetical protein
MSELLEVLFSLAIPTVFLVGYALVLARREDRESRGEIVRPRRSIIPTLAAPDPDAHLGRVGTE